MSSLEELNGGPRVPRADIVLLDLNLPGKGGHALLEEIAKIVGAIDEFWFEVVRLPED